MPGIARVAVACVALIVPTASEANDRLDGSQQIVRTLSLPNGERQRVLYITPPRPRAAIVMLPGGTGDIGLASDGTIAHGENFVVRTRRLWLDRGFAVLIPDALGANMRGERSSPDYAAVVGRLVAFAHTEAKVPVFLLGTSQGSIAAMNAASTLDPGQIAGVVMTESVSREGKSGETVFDAHPERVQAPALIVANTDDACWVAPPQDAPRIAAAMTRSPDVKTIQVEGGSLASKVCGSLSPHGYYGIEGKVVDIVAGWMVDHL
ncbi:MAG: alpha/beta hydrolase [Methylocella sp.]